MATPSLSLIVESLVEPSRSWPGFTITFSFPDATSLWPGYAYNDEQSDPSYGGLGQVQQARFRVAVDAWDDLVAKDFAETSDYSLPGMIRVAFTDLEPFADADTGAYAYYPPLLGGAASTWHGDIWIDDQYAGTTFAEGGYTYSTLIHELGHALGLKHPFEGGQTLPAEYDTTRYTALSYTDYADDTYRWVELDETGTPTSYYDYIYPHTPMVFDIAAIQSIYGADLATGLGDTVYAISDEAMMRAVYDAGGVDTFDLSTHARGSVIDLTPGAYSSIAYWSAADQAAYWTARFPGLTSAIATNFGQASTYTWSNNLGIAYATTIENVIAGAGGDSIRGNTAANSLQGGGGRDSLWGALGDDSLAGDADDDFLRGEEGNDQIRGGAGFDDIHGNMGADTEWGGLGPDWVVGGKDADLLYGEEDDDVVYGNLGNDTLYGGPGADWVRGGQDADSLSGGDGADWMSGDRGDDTLSGGGGADIFHVFADAGIDRVLDFNRAEGDRVLIGDGAAYTTSQIGADVVVDLSGGARLILVGVSLSSLDAGWIG